MSATSRALSLEEYRFPGLDDLPSPALLVFEALASENLARMARELESVVPGSGLRHLRPHVKTHKSAWATALERERGVERFKSTPNELDMLLDAGAADVFVAYPPLPALAEAIAVRLARHSGVRIASQIASLAHARNLARAAAARGVEIEYFVDLDVGAGRTGIRPEEAPGLVRDLSRAAELGRLRLCGLHAYDGHNHAADPRARAACARESMDRVVAALRAIEREGVRVERLCVGGTPGFLPSFEELVRRHHVESRVDVEVSPGTFIYWDSKYDALMPGRFRIAAVILARVMDRTAPDRATLDLGYKRWAIDQGPVDLFSVPGLEVVSTSEEHTVVRSASGESLRLEVGDPVLIAPRHVCATVNLWERFWLVGSDGKLRSEPLPVSARNR